MLFPRACKLAGKRKAYLHLHCLRACSQCSWVLAWLTCLMLSWITRSCFVCFFVFKTVQPCSEEPGGGPFQSGGTLVRVLAGHHHLHAHFWALRLRGHALPGARCTHSHPHEHQAGQDPPHRLQSRRRLKTNVRRVLFQPPRAAPHSHQIEFIHLRLYLCEFSFLCMAI